MQGFLKAVSQATGGIAFLIFVYVIFVVNTVLYADIAGLLFLGVSLLCNGWSAPDAGRSGDRVITNGNMEKPAEIKMDKAKINNIVSQITGGIAFSLFVYLTFDMNVIPYADIAGLVLLGVSVLFNR